MLMASAEDTICSGLGQPVFLQVQMPEGAAVLKVNQIKLPLNHSKKQLKEAIVHKLRIRPEEMIDYRILKQSIDARKSGKGNGQTSKASGNHRQRTGRPVLWAHAGQTGI